MPGENLTRKEAQERASLIKVSSYEIHLDLTSDDSNFGSTTKVKFSASKTGSSTFIDAITHSVQKVVLNGRELDVRQVSDGVRIQLDDLAAG